LKKRNPMLLEEGGNQRLAYSSFSSPVASSESAYVSADGGAVLYLDSVRHLYPLETADKG